MILFSNNSTARLGQATLAAATTIHLGAGQTSLFPEIIDGSGDYFYITIVHPTNETYEILQVVNVLGDSFVVVRAQQGTIALDFPVNSLVELRWTAALAQQVVNYITPIATTTTYGSTRLSTATEFNTGTGDGVVTASQIGGSQNLARKDIVGAIIAYPVSAVPTGYLTCNGASVSRTSYPDLYAVIGTTYGGADNNFNLPDLRGKFIRGTGGAAAVLGTTQGFATQNCQVTARVYGHANLSVVGSVSAAGAYNAGGRNSNAMDGYGNYATFPNITFATETRPINLAMNYCIKY